MDEGERRCWVIEGTWLLASSDGTMMYKAVMEFSGEWRKGLKQMLNELTCTSKIRRGSIKNVCSRASSWMMSVTLTSA